MKDWTDSRVATPPPGDDGAGCLTREVPGRVDLLALRQLDPGRYPHLLQSVAHGPATARFDILFAFPGRTLQSGPEGAGAFLAELDRLAGDPAKRRRAVSDHLPFRGGWFLFLAYELAGAVEPVLGLPRAPQAGPVAFAQRIPAAVIVDHRRGSTTLMVEAGGDPALLEEMARDLERVAGPVGGELPAIRFREEEPSRYLDAVRRIGRYIREGDVFQVNLSRRWTGEAARSVQAERLYARLRRANPAPFSGLATLPGCSVISSSPERLVEVRGERIQTRPIAGTRPRSRRGEEDRRLSEELIGHPKERAEHVMLIDLERNDLGRVCRPGTIEVDELMVLESYAHVHHIVSNVRGRLRPGATAGRIVAAVFPGGTITGCPKVRCMEIIAELEGEGRGAYTGSMGYLNLDGDMDLNILIRTLVVEGPRVHFRAGAGIVADSDPWRELEETRAKARGLLLAVEGKEWC